MSSDGVNKERRRFLIATTSAVGAVGVGFAAVPFIKSWEPSAKATSGWRTGRGQRFQTELRPDSQGAVARPDHRRAEAQRADAGQSDQGRGIASATRLPPSRSSRHTPLNESRAQLDPELLVVNMHCTHLGCVPQLIPEVGAQPFDANWQGGFYCPCHKSKFDLVRARLQRHAGADQSQNSALQLC